MTLCNDDQAHVYLSEFTEEEIVAISDYTAGCRSGLQEHADSASDGMPTAAAQQQDEASTTVLSDEEVAAIQAYLASCPLVWGYFPDGSEYRESPAAAAARQPDQTQTVELF